MKKYISHRQWDCEFDRIMDESGTRDEDGNRCFTTDRLKEAFEKVKKLDDYTVIGFFYQIRYVINRIKENFNNYRSTHIKVGKLVPDGKKFENASLRVKKINWDVHWQTDRILAIIIRDYLRFFIKESPVIGNCVFDDNPEGLSYSEATASDNIDFAGRWKELVSNVADEFDNLRLLIESVYDDSSPTCEEIKAAAEKAFKDLAYIYLDLNW